MLSYLRFSWNASLFSGLCQEQRTEQQLATLFALLCSMRLAKRSRIRFSTSSKTLNSTLCLKVYSQRQKITMEERRCFLPGDAAVILDRGHDRVQNVQHVQLILGQLTALR